jgi:hypothetical protein
LNPVVDFAPLVQPTESETCKKGNVNFEENNIRDGFAFLATATVMAQEPKVASLMPKDLTERPGREVLMITVDCAPDSVGMN